MPYSYRETVKSDVSDELINTYLLRPIAGAIVRLLYATPVRPNHVTIAATFAGLAAAMVYTRGTAEAFVIAGLLVTIKDVLDSADGQLARAKKMYSRFGRFLDSIGDFVVNAAVFGAIGWTLYAASGRPSMIVLSVAGFLGISLRVSYHVYYQTRYLHLGQMYEGNRITEEVRLEDRAGDTATLILQQIFQFLYGWQDRLVLRLDRWSRSGLELEGTGSARWYGDHAALRLSSFLGPGTELLLLTLCSVAGRLGFYLWLNVGLMNGVLLAAWAYRRYNLRRALK
jgi:phosphatidylglycerophosphate synthase